MDELTLLRELDDDVPGPTALADRAARERLAVEIGRSSRRRGPSRRRIAAIAAAGLVVTGGTIALVGDTPRQDPPVVRLVSAKQVLHRAAQRSAAVGTAPIPDGDQYIYAKEILEEGSATFVDETWRSVDGSKPSRISERGRSWIAPPLGKNESIWPPSSYTELAKLPTEPRALLRAVSSWPRGTKRDTPMTATDLESAYIDLLFLLHGWRVMPPGLQAATFDALALIPGVEIVDDDVDARGRHGYGIRRTSGQLAWTVVVDRRTYDYLGMRDGDQLTSLVASGVVDRIGERPADG